MKNNDTLFTIAEKFKKNQFLLKPSMDNTKKWIKDKELNKEKRRKKKSIFNKGSKRILH